MSQIEIDDKGDFTPAQIEKFKSDPAFYKGFVKKIEEDVSGNFPLVSQPAAEGRPCSGRVVI